MPPNFYVLLGVPLEATLDEIKSAYRERVKTLHPDRFDGGSEPFLALQEAYEVLCDPVRRRTYDGQLARSRRIRRAASRARPEPLYYPRHAVEPLIPHRQAPMAGEPLRSSRSPSLFRELSGQLWRDLEAPPLHTADQNKGIHIAVTLTQAQAQRGGRIQLRIPLQVSCPSCRGRGGMGFFECPRCAGSRVLIGDYPLKVAYPEGVADGDTGSIRLRRADAADVHLTLHFRVHGRR